MYIFFYTLSKLVNEGSYMLEKDSFFFTLYVVRGKVRFSMIVTFSFILRRVPLLFALGNKLTCLTKQSGPTRITSTFERPLTGPMSATRQNRALFALGALPTQTTSERKKNIYVRLWFLFFITQLCRILAIMLHSCCSRTFLQFYI